jgi:hypothetical protein
MMVTCLTEGKHAIESGIRRSVVLVSAKLEERILGSSYRLRG